MVSRISFLEAGSCKNLEHSVIQGGRLKSMVFPSSVAVIEHPSEGVILYDTGYSTRFYEVTRRFPEKFYALATPVTVTAETAALAQLKKRGIQQRDVRHVVLSHFHADHVSAIGDFPHAKFWYLDGALSSYQSLSRFRGVTKGFLRELIPQDFEQRSRIIRTEELVPGQYDINGFERGLDLFGDGSVIAISLPGHAPGHLGLLVNVTDGTRYFLVGDAAWISKSFKENKMPPLLTRTLIFDNVGVSRETLTGLHHLWKQRKDITIVPCHCHEATGHDAIEGAATQ